MPSMLMIRRILAPRQLDNPAPTGQAVTVSVSPSTTATSLDIDPNPSDTGAISGLTIPTLTVTTTATTSSISATPSSTSGPASTESGIKLPVIIGIAVAGLVLLVAVALAIAIVVRNKRRNKTRSGSRSQRTHRTDVKEAAAADMSSFLSLNSARGMVRQNAPPPTLPRPDVNNGNLSIPSQFRFTSPTPTRSTESVPSRSSSTSHRRHANDTYALLAPHNNNNNNEASRQYTHVSSPSVAASSLSDYSEAFVLGEYQTAPTDAGGDNVVTRASSMVVIPKSDRAPGRVENGLRRSVSSKPGTASSTTSSARDREFKAMQELIAALDDSRSPFSSSTHLRIDTTQAGMSRLSLGEGMVTPGGLHPVGSGTSFKLDDFPLPPADVFRPALEMESPTE